MKKIIAWMLALSLALSLAGCSKQQKEESGIYTPGTYEGTAQGYGGPVVVSITTDSKSIAYVKITGDAETPAVGGAALEALAEQVKEKGAEIDGVSGATLTSNAVKEAAAAAIAGARGEVVKGNDPLAFTPGAYQGTADGYNGPVTLSVTFSDSAVTGIEIVEQMETAHVGSSAFDILFEDIKAANGTGVDSVSGATFTSRAVKEAVNTAAEQAKATNIAEFKTNAVKHEAQAPMELTYDVVIVGAGGAGLAAGAQAAQNGDTVLIIEKNAEMGGNTLVSGGGYQSVADWLVWDAENPDAATGDYEGVTYDKAKSETGRIDTLRLILTWSEEPFDGTIDEAHPFVAGDIKLGAARGVHPEYLDTLKTLKAQIREYLDWVQPKLDAGVRENTLPLFSTLELHLFQTYYGGLRPSADNSEWVYSKYELARQLVTESQTIKRWLFAQGGENDSAFQWSIIGSLWQRAIFPNMVAPDDASNNWELYFKVPYQTIQEANSENQLLTRTTAEELIVENDRVTGVKATRYDGTPVVAYARKGVILATGGYAANVQMVQQTNVYWNSEYLANNIGTTNRNSLQGDGIRMGQAVGADVTGMGWTQMMPLGWVDNGNLSGGNGEGVIFINAATGKRYVDESAERDVLSLGGFENGMSKEQAEKLGLNYVPGIYVELSNPDTNFMYGGDVEGRQYTWTVDQLAEKLQLDKQIIIDTITEYDNYVMGLSSELSVEKHAANGTIGSVELDDQGNYKPETYQIGKLFVRFLAPSTHHTMGGLMVDTGRHVLDTEGNPIAGLYAAGEVTGGFHAGNRLGGNAITEILVSGRVAAQSVNADNR